MFKRSIAQPLFLIITTVALLVVGAMAWLFHISLARGFSAYVRSAELQKLDVVEKALLSRYQEQGNWQFLTPGQNLLPVIDRYVRSHPNLRQPWGGRPRPPGREMEALDNLPLEPDGLPPPPEAGFPPGEPPFRPGGPPPVGEGAMADGPAPRQENPPMADRPAANSFPGEGQPLRPPSRRPGLPPPGPGRDTLGLGNRVALLDPAGSYLAGNSHAEPEPRRPLFQGEGEERQLVGYLILTSPIQESAQAGQDFIASQSRNIAAISVLAVLFSGLAALGTAGLFRRPIRELAEGTHRLAGGDLSFRLAERRRDELGEMARDFNRMAETLEAYEQARRQWVADSSHELRTPITILSTHLEAMRDGVLPTSPEKLGVLATTVESMERLVSDLHQLARADAGAHDYRFEPVPVAGLCAELEDSFTPRLATLGLTLAIRDWTPPGTCIQADRLRLMQILSNLLTNSSRYTDSGGQVRLTARAEDEHLVLVVEDSAPGVPDEALPRLFDRFYRVDVSRSRRSGGSGLGLAICKAIVVAHGGHIDAAPSPLGGLRVSVGLPLAPASL